MFRVALFQLHWFLGITAGVVLAVMGVTGAIISFEDELLVALNPGVASVGPGRGPLLAPPDLAARVLAQHPGARVSRIVANSNPGMAAQISYTLPDSKKRRVEFADPVDGRLLGEGKGHDFFEFVTRLHRWLALPDGSNGIGRQITGFAAVSLIYFALSGLYLRWPRQPLDWRAWLVLDWRKTGRNLYRALHATIGGWVLIFYLISGLTGLWWSYGWYRDGAQALLVGTVSKGEVHGKGGSKGKAGKDAVPDLSLAWSAFTARTAPARYEHVTLIVRDGAVVQFRAKLEGGRHDRVSDEVSIDGRTGSVPSFIPYAKRSMGQDIVTSIFEIHRGAYFGIVGRIGFLIASLTMPLFTITGFLLYFARRRAKRALAQAQMELAHSPAAPPLDRAKTLVAYASQTGGAERLARLTASALPDAAVVPVSRLDPDQLARVERLFVVASTYGEGEPPDMARAFARRLKPGGTGYPDLDYAVLALGDREYPDFCAFGHQVDQWLHQSGAHRLFDIVEMDGQDADAQRQWQQQLGGIGARTDQPDWAPAPMGRWRLVERRLLNQGSSGGAIFHVALEPFDPASTDWRPGDIIEIMPRQDAGRIAAFAVQTGNALTDETQALLATRILPPDGKADTDLAGLRPLAHREYSIASIALSGRVDLIVRQCVAEDGFPGLGSGWLTQGAEIGGSIEARIRSNSGFHPPQDDNVPLLLIGNGTGLAGLLAHIRARAANGGAPVHLFWGERHPDHDAIHGEEIARLARAGVIATVDIAWSRLERDRAYVQDRLRARADLVKALIYEGAAIYVCGSIAGMAPAVHQALADIASEEILERMVEAGAYRRDIY